MNVGMGENEANLFFEPSTTAELGCLSQVYQKSTRAQNWHMRLNGYHLIVPKCYYCQGSESYGRGFASMALLLACGYATEWIIISFHKARTRRYVL